MIALKEFRQERLALFVVSRDSGTPLRKVPIYAEMVLAPLPPDANHAGWRSATLGRIAERSPAVASQIAAAIGRAVDADWLEANDGGQALEQLVTQLVAGLDGQGLLEGDASAEEREKALIERLELLILRYEIPKRQAIIDAPPLSRVVPLGVLATDHAGFVSFDLGRIRKLGGIGWQARGTGVAFHAYPMLLDSMRVDVLAQRRIAPDAIVGKLELMRDAEAPLPGFALNLPAMQNPGLVDWRLSPGSFAAVPQTLIGTDGCEALTPANFATSQFHLRQVVRLDRTVPGTAFPECYVNEYTVSLIPIGHSLGQVLYSLPLAPGETVRLAVIDWRRQDAGKREDKAIVTEALVHEQTRDRAITETMTAALSEWQRGGSVMGGLASGAGASGQLGPLSVVGGSMLSIGGAYATSSGNRDIVAGTAQKVTDAIHQASTSVREIQSTVVVQTDQQERQNVMTRAFSNHNRGHTLTVLYYEVLRHFRVVTEHTRRTRAVLLPGNGWDLRDEALLLNRRYLLEPALLDQSLVPAFAALHRADRLRKDRQRNPPVPVYPPGEKDLRFSHFRFRFAVGNERSTNALGMYLVLKGGQRVTLLYGGSGNWNKDEQFNADHHFTINSDPLPQPVPWGDMQAFEFRKTSGSTAVRVYHLEVDGVGDFGSRLVHPHSGGSTYYLNNDDDKHVLPVQAPAPSPPPVQPASFEQALDLDDHVLIERLKGHLQSHSAYYARLLDLSQHPNAYAIRFENDLWSGQQKVIDAVAPTPLEIMGSRVAFPLLDQEEQRVSDAEPVERLISLPTRGVFAEAKLGHCNVAEEIDETRFWRWDEHPLPFVASDIAPVQPIQPRAQAPDLTPTAPPAPVATIQAAPALPDPTGLAALLKALVVPDAFRDMSAKAEVQDLLGDLIKGTVDMAQAANRAKEIQSKLDTDLDRQRREEAIRAVESSNAVRRAELEAGLERARQVTPAEAAHAIKNIDNQAAQGKISKESRNEKVETLLGNQRGVGTPKPKPAPPAPQASAGPGKGLVFNVLFQNIGDRIGMPVSGFASAVIQDGKTGRHMTFSRARLQNSSLRLEVPEVENAGTISVTVEYDWNTFDSVVADALGKAGTPLKPVDYIRTFSGTTQYATDKGALVQLVAQPAAEQRKKTAKSAKEAVTALEAEGTLAKNIFSIGAKASQGETVTVGQETEWTIYVMTGGLEIKARS